MSVKSSFKAALLSRAVVLVLQFAFNALVPDHDAGVFDPPPSTEPSAADKAVVYLLGGCRRWDAVYFMHVAEHGYTYENALAFFPGFPLAVRLLASALPSLPGGGPDGQRPLLAQSSRLLVAAVALNVVCFALSAVALHELTLAVTRDPLVSRRAVYWYCYNPASVFMSAAYSESLFAALSFSTMYCVETSNYLAATALLAAATGTRSNGVVLCGYFAFDALKQTLASVASPRLAVAARVRSVATAALRAVACAACGLLPLAAFQWYAYTLYCDPARWPYRPTGALLAYGLERNYTMPGPPPLPPWCSLRVPLSYAHVQRHHWNVGFLNYYELRQLPNFLLAAPGAALSLLCSLRAAVALLEASRAALLRPPPPPLRRRSAAAVAAALSSIRELGALPYAVHLAALVVFGWLCMHVQVLTRMLFSSSPLICQTLGRASARGTHSDERLVSCAKAYFAAYFVIGVFLHSNGLPWT